MLKRFIRTVVGVFAAVAGVIGFIAFAFHNARVIARGIAGKEAGE